MQAMASSVFLVILQDPGFPGRYPNTVQARSVLCHWAIRELGISTLELSKRLNVSQPTAGQSAKRGEEIVRKMGLKLNI